MPLLFCVTSVEAFCSLNITTIKSKTSDDEIKVYEIDYLNLPQTVEKS